MKPFHPSIQNLSHEKCVELLQSKMFCHLGCTDGNEAYVVPMSYVYEEGKIFCHSREGKKIDFLRTGLVSCIQIEDVEDFYNWKSVSATCRFNELTGDEASRCARLIIGHFKHLHKVTALEEDFSALLDSSVVFSLDIISLSGRFEKRNL